MILSLVLVLPTFFFEPANKVSYPFIDSLTSSRLSTESGLDNRDAASETVRKVLLCTSCLKEEKMRVERTLTRTRTERVPTMSSRLDNGVVEVMGDVAVLFRKVVMMKNIK